MAARTPLRGGVCFWCTTVFAYGATARSAILQQMHNQNPAGASPESRGTTRIRCTQTQSCLHSQRGLDGWMDSTMLSYDPSEIKIDIYLFHKLVYIYQSPLYLVQCCGQVIPESIDPYHECWCPGRLCRQAISTGDERDLLYHEYYFQLPAPLRYQDITGNVRDIIGNLVMLIKHHFNASSVV